jgi:hypothetical protein
VLHVVVDPVLYEVFKDLFRRRGLAPVEMAYRLDAAVEIHFVQDRFYVGEVQAVHAHVQRLLSDLSGFELYEEIVEVFVDPGPQGTHRMLLFVRRELDRHHYLGLDLHDRAASFFGHPPTPPLLQAQVAHVADDKGGVLTEVERHLVRGAAARYELDLASLSASYTSCKPSNMKA